MVLQGRYYQDIGTVTEVFSVLNVNTLLAEGWEILKIEKKTITETDPTIDALVQKDVLVYVMGKKKE